MSWYRLRLGASMALSFPAVICRGPRLAGPTSKRRVVSCPSRPFWACGTVLQTTPLRSGLQGAPLDRLLAGAERERHSVASDHHRTVPSSGDPLQEERF